MIRQRYESILDFPYLSLFESYLHTIIIRTQYDTMIIKLLSWVFLSIMRIICKSGQSNNHFAGKKKYFQDTLNGMIPSMNYDNLKCCSFKSLIWPKNVFQKC